MFDSTSSSSFTSELVNELVLHASSVFSLSDILKRFPVFSLGHAKLILEIFQEIFEDIPYFDEMMATLMTCFSWTYIMTVMKRNTSHLSQIPIQIELTQKN